MLRKILVPLDGSEVAEAVLPYVEELCHRCELVEVILLQVVLPPPGRSGSVFRPMVENGYSGTMAPDTQADANLALHPIYREREIASVRGEVEHSLERAVQRLCEEEAILRVEVVFGRPAEEIVDFAEREGVDLIAMSTHGRSGLSRWIFGSVTDKVLHGTHLPILLVRPPGLTGTPFPPQSEIEI